MSWEIGFDASWKRDIGYGVPAFCDHPGCNNVIDRGLAHVCGGEPFGGKGGCGLYFCEAHHSADGQRCERCERGLKPFESKPDHKKWLRHKLEHSSWMKWRAEHPKEVEAMRQLLAQRNPRTPYSEEERIAAGALKGCTFPVGSWDKRFMRNLSPDGLTEKERPQLWRLFIRYRRQIDCPRKAELLGRAEGLAAPDYRKLQAASRAQRRIEELKRKYQEQMADGKAL